MKFTVALLMVCLAASAQDLSDHACQCTSACESSDLVGLGTKFCSVNVTVCTDATKLTENKDKCGDSFIDGAVNSITKQFDALFGAGGTATNLFGKVATWTSDNLKKIPIDDIKAWTKEQLDQIPIEKVAEMTADQIKNINGTWLSIKVNEAAAAGKSAGAAILSSATAQQLKDMSADAITKLSDADWDGLKNNLGAVGQWTADKVKLIPVDQMKTWTGAQLQKIPVDQITAFTKEQLNAIPFDKMMEMSKEQLAKVDTTWFQEKIKAIPVDQIKTWTGAQLQKIPVDQITAFTKEQINAIPFDKLKTMTKEQLAKIDPNWVKEKIDAAKAAGEDIGNFGAVSPTVAPAAGAAPTSGTAPGDDTNGAAVLSSTSVVSVVAIVLVALF